MPNLGLTSTLSSSGGLITPGVITSNLVMKHMYPAGTVQPLSDGAAYFDESEDNYISVVNHADFQLGTTGDLSITAWIYTGDNTDQGIIGKYGDADNRWYFRLDNEGQLQFYSRSDASGAARVGWSGGGSSAAEVLATNTWYHVAMSGDRSNTSTGLKFYVNGVFDEEASNGIETDNIDNDGDFLIGARTTTNTFGDGYICNLGIWSGALTQAQIKSIMWKQYADLTDGDKDAGTTGTPNLVSWWNLDNTITTDGTVNFVLDEVDTTLTTAPDQTWVVQSGSPSVSGQEITFTAGEVQQVGCTLSTGIGYYKVNMTLENHSGDSISLLWDGGSTSDLITSTNGTHEWITYLDASPNIHANTNVAGKVTVNSIKKYNGNAGQLI